MMEQKNMTPRDFLTMLWGEPPPGPVYLFLLPQKRAVWFTHYENLNRLAGAHSDMDLYTGGGMGPRDNRQTLPNRRLTQDEVTGITGLWADIDVAHEVHTKKKPAPDHPGSPGDPGAGPVRALPARGQRPRHPGLVALR